MLLTSIIVTLQREKKDHERRVLGLNVNMFDSAFFFDSYSNFFDFSFCACVDVFSAISFGSYNFGILKKLGMIFP